MEKNSTGHTAVCWRPVLGTASTDVQKLQRVFRHGRPPPPPPQPSARRTAKHEQHKRNIEGLWRDRCGIWTAGSNAWLAGGSIMSIIPFPHGQGRLVNAAVEQGSSTVGLLKLLKCRIPKEARRGESMRRAGSEPEGEPVDCLELACICCQPCWRLQHNGMRAAPSVWSCSRCVGEDLKGPILAGVL